MVSFRCPNCSSSVVTRRMKRHGWSDFLHRFFGMYPWYCKACRKRFYKRKRSVMINEIDAVLLRNQCSTPNE